VVLGRRFLGESVKYHFDLFGDGKFVYVYMYKNACSVFKKIVFESFGSPGGLTPLEALGQRRVTIEAAKKADVRLFVAREPIGRVVSGFLNQVVTKIDRSYPEMFDQLEIAAKKPVHEITFRDFVLEYLVKSDWSNVNAHFLPMSESLAPLYYDAAIDIDCLYESAVVLFGQDFASKYFKKKINSTSESVADEFANLTDISVLDLFHKVKSERMYPDKMCFIDDEVATVLSKIYAKDIEVYSLVSGGSTFKSFDNRMHSAS
tara:strand:+ start:17 stop:799 length:783 start_codon:yes stop_codon:yes gene_type:complete